MFFSRFARNFDILCKDEETGEEFIVEMQFGKQNTYRERMPVYATYPIRTQMAEKMMRYNSGESLDKMDYSLRPVYVLSFLNFALEHENEKALDADNGLISRYAVRNDRNGELMTDALHFIYVEMDRFPYKENEETMRNELDISLEKRYVKEEAFKEGREAGLAEGEAKGREAIARKLRDMGMAAEDILKATGIAL